MMTALLLKFEHYKAEFPKIYTDSTGQLWEVVGLNERMRILRYNEGIFLTSIMMDHTIEMIETIHFIQS